MSNFELIDDYLSNRLAGKEKLDFESQMAADPALQAEVTWQQNIIAGVREARVMELKTMLNSVPVTGGLGSATLAAKVAATVVATGVISVAIYFTVQSFTNERQAVISPTEQVTKPEEESMVKESVIEQPAMATVPAEATPEKGVTKPNSVQKPAVTQKPKINVVDPSTELNDNASSPKDPNVPERTSTPANRISVDIRNSDKQYVFHYRFEGNQLILFGQFDKSLYEILEINGDQHSVFLYYKEVYYVLDEKKQETTRLEPIKDPVLIRKLNKYRAQ